MAESIFARVSRLLSATVEDTVDRMEQAGGEAVMREAIREADRAIDQVKAQLEAATARSNSKNLTVPELRYKLKAIDQAARAAVEKDPLARHRESLAGGDAEKGRAIFLNSAAVYCQRIAPFAASIANTSFAPVTVYMTPL